MSEPTWIEVDEREEWVARGMKAMRRAGHDAVERARSLGLEPVEEEPTAGLPFDTDAHYGDALERLPPAAVPRAAE